MHIISLVLPKKKGGSRPRKDAIIVKEEKDEDRVSKNWPDDEVHTLIAFCKEMEREFMKNAKTL